MKTNLQWKISNSNYLKKIGYALTGLKHAFVSDKSARTVISIVVHIAVLVPLAFTNAIFLDAERDNAPWLFEWRSQQEQWKFWKNRPSTKGKNIITWDIDREA